MTFCIDSIDPGALRAHDGVLRVQSIAVSSDAQALAARIRDHAHEQAEAIVNEARAHAERLVREAERKTLEQALQLMQELERAQATYLDRSKDMVITLAETLFDRIAVKITPRDRLEAMLRRILHEAPPKLVDPVLRVHPDERAHLPALTWEIVEDPDMRPGACRLEAVGGEWRADFAAGVEALKLALRDMRGPGEGETAPAASCDAVSAAQGAMASSG